MIEKLTEEQERNLINFRDECLKIGLSTEPIKRNITDHKKLLDFIYKNYLGLPAPAIWYVDSPLMFNLVMNILYELSTRFKDNLQSNLQDNIQGNLWSNLQSNLWSNLKENLWNNLRGNIQDNLQSDLKENLWNNLRGNIQDNLQSDLWSNLQSNLWSNLQDNIQSNLQGNIRSNLQGNLKENLWNNLRGNIQDNIQGNLWSNLQSNLWSNLQDNIQSNLQGNIRSNLQSNLWSNLRSNLRSNLQSNLQDNLQDNIQSNLKSNLKKLKRFENVYWGNVDVFWQAYYLFPMSIGIKYKDFEIMTLNNFFELSKKIGFIWYFKGICFISDRPIHIHRKGIQLHHESEPAISFKDGYSIWCLHGVNVPRKLVETPKEKFDIEFFKNEKNADIKAEFIRKYGIERMVSLGRVIETVTEESNEWYKRSEYQLIDMGKIFDIAYAPHLKMKNLTTGIYHLEAVSPECQTIDSAIKYRCGNKNVKIEGIK